MLRELRETEVHRHAHARETEALPTLRIDRRLPEHPLTDGDDQTRRLEQRQEVTGRKEPGFRMLPAQQRLGSHNAAGVPLDLRLVVQPKLVPLQRRLHAAFETSRFHRFHGVSPHRADASIAPEYRNENSPERGTARAVTQ